MESRDLDDGSIEWAVYSCFTYREDADRWAGLPHGPLRVEVSGPYVSPLSGPYFAVHWWGPSPEAVRQHRPDRAP